MEITKKNLILAFGTSAKTEETITITNPSATLEAGQIKVAMTQALASGAIGENVPATSIVGAKYMIQQVDTINLDEV